MPYIETRLVPPPAYKGLITCMSMSSPTTRLHNKVLNLRGDQSTERKEYIPGEGTNQLRGKSVYLERGPFN
eukprot:1194684-Prorocentrum_minimum.AAC.5